MSETKERAERARDFPRHTCPASRHVMLMADALHDGKRYPMFEEEPDYCADALYSVVASLWECRRTDTELVEALREAREALAYIRSTGLNATAAFVRRNPDATERMHNVLDKIDGTTDRIDAILRKREEE